MYFSQCFCKLFYSALLFPLTESNFTDNDHLWFYRLAKITIWSRSWLSLKKVHEILFNIMNSIMISFFISYWHSFHILIWTLDCFSEGVKEQNLQRNLQDHTMKGLFLSTMLWYVKPRPNDPTWTNNCWVASNFLARFSHSKKWSRPMCACLGSSNVGSPGLTIQHHPTALENNRRLITSIQQFWTLSSLSQHLANNCWVTQHSG